MVNTTQRPHLMDCCTQLEHSLFCLAQHKLSLWSKSQQFCNWHANSSHRSIVQLSRERITPRDLESNLSQTSHLVLVHSEPVISICKQLKRTVAFSTVQTCPLTAASISVGAVGLLRGEWQPLQGKRPMQAISIFCWHFSCWHLSLVSLVSLCFTSRAFVFSSLPTQCRQHLPLLRPRVTSSWPECKKEQASWFRMIDAHTMRKQHMNSHQWPWQSWKHGPCTLGPHLHDLTLGESKARRRGVRGSTHDKGALQHQTHHMQEGWIMHLHLWMNW